MILIRVLTSITFIKRPSLILFLREILKHVHMTWDPYYTKDIDSLENMQRHAAIFIMRDHNSFVDGCVTLMLSSLNHDSLQLQQRLKKSRLDFLLKNVRVIVLPINKSSYLAPIRNKSIQNLKIT